MYIIATASADTYITNKIIDGVRATDANVGRAGTLDLFKLYDETVSGTTANNIEISRILVKFDISRLSSIGTLNINDPTFRSYIRLQSIESGLPSPRDFTVSVFPLAVPFDEGDGRDVSAFSDIDTCNFLSSSAGTGWNISGAYATGGVGDSAIDFYTSGNLQDGLGIRSLESKQQFSDGNEDLFVEVTDIVSATLGGILQNNGFIISFSGSQETDDITRFVKRFASRHVINHALRPRLESHFKDSIIDSHNSFYFDTTGSLFLTNDIASSNVNIVSASSPVVGNDCMKIVLSTGSFAITQSVSQAKIGNSFLVGVYSSSFAINAFSAQVITGTLTLKDAVAASGSIIFDERWKSNDGSVTFYSSQLTCSLPNRNSGIGQPRQLIVKAVNSQQEFQNNSNYRFRLFIYDPNFEPSAARMVRSLDSESPEALYFRVIDAENSYVYIPFEEYQNGTRVSQDSSGAYFDVIFDGLPIGKTLMLEYLVVDKGIKYILRDAGSKFRVK
jgi:hypothetical protein